MARTGRTTASKSLALKKASAAIPQTEVAARDLPSDILHKLEIAGEIATEILDERVEEWVDEGKTQLWMANELGCTQKTISLRMKRLGLKTPFMKKRPNIGKHHTPRMIPKGGGNNNKPKKKRNVKVLDEDEWEELIDDHIVIGRDKDDAEPVLDIARKALQRLRQIEMDVKTGNENIARADKKGVIETLEEITRLVTEEMLPIISERKY